MLSRIERWLLFPVLLLILAFYILGLSFWQNRSASSAIENRTQYVNAETDITGESDKLNLNTATKEELMGIDGIGEKTAERILEKREQLGEFKVVEQLTEIKGIGEKTFDSIKEFITVE